MNKSFTLLSKKQIPELHTKALHFKHKRTGAEVVILENDDENKVFGINFKTLPTDNTGVAHILEHLVFNGSKKYPVKNLIDELIKTSVNTYVNAFTSADRTTYPIASQNSKDFYNLASVYISMCLEPLLQKEGFLQEGWRIEKKESEYQISGIVFNEMKAYSLDPEVAIWRKSLAHLLPDTIYSHESGGNPTEIPNLSYEDLLAFHKKFYNVSKAKFFFYGDGDTANHLKFLDEQISDFNPLKQSDVIKKQKVFAPKQVVEKYPATQQIPISKQYSFVQGWLLPEHISVKQRYGLYLLNYLLLGSDSAPLKNALIEAGLGESVIDDGFYLGFNQGNCLIGVQNGEKQNVLKAKEIIFEQLENHSKNGFKKQSIQAALEINEFSLREVGNANPRGLSLFQKILTEWNFDRNPLEILSFESIYSEFRETLLKDDSYLSELVSNHFLRNTSQISMLLEPDSTIASKIEAKNEAMLKKKLDEQSEKIISTNQKNLESYQSEDTNQAKRTLPNLTIKDLDKNITKIEHELTHFADAKVLIHALPTNGIVYADIAFDISHLSSEEIQYLSLLESLIFRVDTKQYSRDEFADKIDTFTGGISTDTLFSETVQGGSERRFFLKGRALYRNADALIELMGTLMHELKLDNSKVIKDEIIREKSDIESGITYSGHSYALSKASSSLNESAYLNEQSSGISYLEFIRMLVKKIDENPEELLENLNSVYRKIFTRNNLSISIASEDSFADCVENIVHKFIDLLPRNSAYSEVTHKIPNLETNIGYAIQSEVQFNAMVLPVDTNNISIGGIVSANKLASLNYMWKEVRLKNGAYGGGMRFDVLGSSISFFSYRDPALDSSFKIFENVTTYLKEAKIESEELKKGIIGVIGDSDSHILPSRRGFVSLQRELLGTTDSYRQKIRDEIFQTTKNDFKIYGELLEAGLEKSKSLVSIGGKKALKKSKLITSIKELL